MRKANTLAKVLPADKAGKNFDAVKTMRDIRDQVSKEIMNMSFAEEKAYLKNCCQRKQ